MRASNNEKRLGVITRTAKETREYRVRMKILGILFGCLCSLLAVVYVFAVFYESSGSFTVSLDKYDMARCGLSLSETSDLRYKSSNLNARIAEEMTNISGDWIPENVDASADGEHNGKDYMAYTFYLTNAGKEDVSYEHRIVISNITKGLDHAIRVRLYVNGTPTTYARKSANETPEPGTVPFNSEGEVMSARVDNFKPGDVTKYTMVIWIEGDDPECTDFVLGGKLKIDMQMDVVDQK